MRIGKNILRRAGAISGYAPKAASAGWGAPTGYAAQFAAPIGQVARAGPAMSTVKRINPAVRGLNRAMAGKGKYAAGAVAAGMAINVIRTRSGAGADKPRGRPTGMYQY